jgi:hypothetical protein
VREPALLGARLLGSPCRPLASAAMKPQCTRSLVQTMIERFGKFGVFIEELTLRVDIFNPIIQRGGGRIKTRAHLPIVICACASLVTTSGLGCSLPIGETVGRIQSRLGWAEVSRYLLGPSTLPTESQV